MHSQGLTARLSNFNAQSLLLEFASVRHARLEGIYVSLTTGDPTLWVGVIFVRQGPYAPAILRFHISFPPGYPSLPPLVTFSTDLFHPLLTPLTTYTYTTGSIDGDTVSATDDERLPPGVFSLRHGFPQLFSRGKKGMSTSRNASDSTQGLRSPTWSPTQEPDLNNSAREQTGRFAGQNFKRRQICVVEILKYIQSTFSDESVLDSISLDAAANPGAFHAWRTYRGEVLKSASPSLPEARTSAEVPNTPAGRKRRPGEWNWEGVWQERVKKGIRNSVSDAVLFGSGPEEIQFLDMDQDSLTRARREIEASTVALQ